MPEYSHQNYVIYDLPIISCPDVPEWEKVSIDDIALVIGGGTPDTSVSEFWNPAEFPWATPTDITSCEGIFISETERCISEKGLMNSSGTLLPINSCLLTSRATIGECRLNTVPMATNQGFASLVSKDNVDPFFIFYLTHHLKPTLTRLAAGTTYNEISRREVRKIRCLIPKSKDEQREIASALLSVDNAIAMAREKLEAARRLKTALMQQLFTRGIPGKHQRFKETKIGEIPESWDVVELGSLLASTQYGLSDSFSERGRYQILRMMNIEDGFVNANYPVYIDLDDATFQVYRLEVGDILFNRTNSLELVGRVGIVHDPIEAVFASYLVRLKADIEKVNPFFLNYCLNSHRVKCRYRRFATPAVGQANINSRNLKKTLIAIPKKESGEQDEIVSLIALCDKTIEGIASKQDALILLKKSLLQNLLTGRVRVNAGARA